MGIGEIVSGQQSGWSLLEKLGEGDAGEVYRVESLLEKKTAILKRPYRNSFSTDILRQANQIVNEGKLLRSLNRLSLSERFFTIQVPGILDQSRPGTEFSDRLFIIIDLAQGFDLNSLARFIHLGPAAAQELPGNLSHEERSFIEVLVQKGEIPALILLRALAGLASLFEKIHFEPARLDEDEKSGVIWNDVKPEHLFWDPAQARFTVIDWGNGQFLEEDGATKDRRNSRIDDYYQFVQEMGKFLASNRPDLLDRLEWPAEVTPGTAYTEAVKPLTERISVLLQEELAGLRAARQQESDLILSSRPTLEHLHQLEQLQEQVAGYGELPDYAGTQKFYVNLAASLASHKKLAAFQQICTQAVHLPGVQPEKWRLLGQIASLDVWQNHAKSDQLKKILLAGLSEDWAAVLWELQTAASTDPEPGWLSDLCHQVRASQPEIGPDALTPYVTINRIMHTLQAAALKLGDVPNQNLSNGAGEDANGQPDQVQAYKSLIGVLKEEVVKKWKQREPDPPDSGLAYDDVDRLLEDSEALLPGSRQTINKVLDQPKAQVKIILDAWNRKEFDTALKGLRRVLLWDPDRRRVFQAEWAILSTPSWLEKVYQGPQKDEPVQDFVTNIELSGRELRNQVGSARWLDLILDALAQLRKGANPADLVLEHPELLSQMPWLSNYDAFRPATPQRTDPVRLPRAIVPLGNEHFFSGVKESVLGIGEEFLLGEPLDTWAPEARGSSARVFNGFLMGPRGRQESAIKIMRADRADYAMPLFREEVQILTLMRDVPGVNAFRECGFIKLQDGSSLPSDDRTLPASDLRGAVLRLGVNEVRDFVNSLEIRTTQGWLPYLALEKRDRSENLMTLCDVGYTHGKFLPLAEALRLAIQICDILQTAHARNIVYRDHKILHYYWQEVYNGVLVIDWNVAQRHPQGLSKTEKQADLVQFGARALHHIIAGRPAPGALPLGPTRPIEIDQAAETYTPQWTYDDQRLPTRVKDILENVLAGGYSDVKALREDLKAIFVQLPETVV